MTPATALLVDAYSRVRGAVPPVVEGLTVDQLAHRLDPGANTIAWLVWHLARVQDDHVADAFGAEQVWTAEGWAERFGLPLDPCDTGYGHTADHVAAVRAPAGLLRGYADAVAARTLEHLRGLREGDLDRVVDESYDPPVTLAVRLVSVVEDGLQHAGQAAFLRGVLDRRALAGDTAVTAPP